MAVSAVLMNEVHSVRSLRYAWAEDGTVLLTLDCHDRDGKSGVMTFGELKAELASLCQWQLKHSVVIGTTGALAEVLTIYHAFEYSQSSEHSLMLVSTPPEEYFEAQAA